MDLMQLAEDFDPTIMQKIKGQKKRTNANTITTTGQVWTSSSTIGKKKVQFPNMLQTSKVSQRPRVDGPKKAV